MLTNEMIIACLLLGGVVGVMAGLLGIGGGGIMVPMLTSLFIYQGVSSEMVVHMALGTSMASMVVTALSSLRSHHVKRGVLWNVVKAMLPGILMGAFAAAFIASILSTVFLALFFAAFMLFVAIQMFLNKKPKSDKGLPSKAQLFLVGSGIGSISSLVSIGGGSLMVPYFLWRNIDIKQAIGSSAAVGFFISMAGTAGYLISGWQSTHEEAFVIGYIYWPAVLLISAVSFFTAPLGVKLAYRIPVANLKKIFGLLLFILSAKMLFSVL
jgi:uncharacterized membrane protein YfcA